VVIGRFVVGSDGKPLIREDGKVLKSEKYFPLDIESVLSMQARVHGDDRRP
jgi:hypothetical protein